MKRLGLETKVGAAFKTHIQRERERERDSQGEKDLRPIGSGAKSTKDPKG